MFATYQQLDFQLQLFLFPVWLVAAIAVGRLARRPDQHRLRRSSRFLLGWLLLALLLVLGRVFADIMMGTAGLVFIADRIALTMLAMIPAALAVLVLSVPRLMRLIQSVRGGRDTPVTTEQLREAVTPGLTVPIRLAALASVLGFFEKFLPVDNSLLFVVTVPILGLILGAALLLASAVRRARRILAGRRVSPWRRWSFRLVAVGVVLALVGTYVSSGLRDTIPETFSMMQGEHDLGGGAPVHHHVSDDGQGNTGIDVTTLTGPQLGEPTKRFVLTADEKKIKLASGKEVDAWAFNGQIPGPEIRVTEGDVVEVQVVNQLDDAPVAVHWHGLDVPNAMDGVAGVTQDAVAPGASFTYKFRVDEVGTRWYHSHQAASEQVSRGLFGPLVIEPNSPGEAAGEDITLVLHDWNTDGGRVTAFGTADQLDRRTIAAGTPVRLRLTNAANTTHDLAVLGTPFRVVALDGTDLHNPAELQDSKLVVGSANRVDVEFTMPSGPVRVVDLGDPDSGVLFSPDGQGEVAVPDKLTEVDFYTYGEKTTTPFGPDSDFDRTYRMVFDGGLGFYDGAFALRQTINGGVFPNVPMHMVKEGELVRFRFINRGEEDHPMHIHGHHFLVLSRNGKEISGSPVWLDTVLVRPGDIIEVGLRADNPGIWMDHCHNFDHTKLGMVMHLAYAGVTSPFVVGGAAGNRPD